MYNNSAASTAVDMQSGHVGFWGRGCCRATLRVGDRPSLEITDRQLRQSDLFLLQVESVPLKSVKSQNSKDIFSHVARIRFRINISWV